MELYQVTGNEYLSLPTIRQEDGRIEGIAFLMMQLKGLLEVRGDDGLIRPYLCIGGRRQAMRTEWSREYGWIPTLRAECETVSFSCTYLTPLGERALALRLCARNRGEAPVDIRIGTDGRWDRTLHEINETSELCEGREVVCSGWNDMFIWSQKPGVPLFACAPCLSDPQPFSQIDQGAQWSQDGFA